MAIIQELVTLLGFKTDHAGARAYDREFDALERRASAAAAAVSEKAHGFARVAMGAVAAVFSANAIQSAVKASDELITAMNQLTSATDDPGRAAEAFEAIYESATQTGIAVGSTSQAFMRFFPAMEKAGYGMQQTVDMLSGLQKGLIAAGSSAHEAGETIRQMGQAINQGKLNDDELTRLLETSSPKFLEAFATAMGHTVDELKELGSKGKLTNDVVLPALAKAAAVVADEFDRMGVTSELALARLTVRWKRFIGELYQATGIGRVVARVFVEIGDRIEAWRKRLPELTELIDKLGGIERILQVVAIAAGLAGAAMLIMARNTLLAIAPWVAGAVAIGAVALLLHDLWEWMSGSDTQTLFGEWFGPFNEAIEPFRENIERVKQIFSDFMDAANATFGDGSQARTDVVDFLTAVKDFAVALWRAIDEVGTNLGLFMRQGVEEIKSGAATIKGLWEGLQQVWNTTKEVFQSVISFIGDIFGGFVSRLVGGFASIGNAIDAFKDRLRGLGGTREAETQGGIGAGNRTGIEDWLRQNPIQPQSFNPDAAAGMIGRGGSGPVNQTQQNNISVQVPVTATGASGAEVAGGAEAGVRRAVDRMVDSLTTVQAGMPLIEAASA